MTYDLAGPTYHCRIGTWDRTPYLGSSHLADGVVAALVHYHGVSVDVLTYCVMPDHVHVLVGLAHDGKPLSGWVADLKRWTVHQARKGGLSLRWQPGFYEHVVRKSEDVAAISGYILANPVRAGLAEEWRAYRWCGSLAWEL